MTDERAVEHQEGEAHCEGCCGGPMWVADIRAMELASAMEDGLDAVFERYQHTADPATAQWWGECVGGPDDGLMHDFHTPSPEGFGMPVWHLEPAPGEQSPHFGTSGTLGWYRAEGWKDEELRIATLRWEPGWEDGIG
ncbi:MAG TPA: hypothetical protein VJ850_09045 [Candidatus Limnocylindrales bacterium]|nr:hypothetical protein [Candidatus Limnocylindrales bacterium]